MGSSVVLQVFNKFFDNQTSVTTIIFLGTPQEQQRFFSKLFDTPTATFTNWTSKISGIQAVPATTLAYAGKMNHWESAVFYMMASTTRPQPVDSQKSRSIQPSSLTTTPWSSETRLNHASSKPDNFSYDNTTQILTLTQRTCKRPRPTPSS